MQYLDKTLKNLPRPGIHKVGILVKDFSEEKLSIILEKLGELGWKGDFDREPNDLLFLANYPSPAIIYLGYEYKRPYLSWDPVEYATKNIDEVWKINLNNKNKISLNEKKKEKINKDIKLEEFNRLDLIDLD